MKRQAATSNSVEKNDGRAGDWHRSWLDFILYYLRLGLNVIDPSPESRSRFKGDNGVNLAETVIEARFKSGEGKRVRLLLGHPFRREGQEGAYGIRVELEGLESTKGPIMGLDQFQAIVLALRFLVSRLRDLRDKLQCEYYWPDSDGDVFDFEAFFAVPTQDSFV